VVVGVGLDEYEYECFFVARYSIFKASSRPMFEDEYECFFVNMIDEMME